MKFILIFFLVCCSNYDKPKIHNSLPFEDIFNKKWGYYKVIKDENLIEKHAQKLTEDLMNYIQKELAEAKVGIESRTENFFTWLKKHIKDVHDSKEFSEKLLSIK